MGNRARALVENSQVQQRQAAPGQIAVNAYDRDWVMLGGGALPAARATVAVQAVHWWWGVLANTLAAEWLGSEGEQLRPHGCHRSERLTGAGRCAGRCRQHGQR